MNIFLPVIVTAKTDGRSNFAAQHIAAAEHFVTQMAVIEQQAPPDPQQFAPQAYFHYCSAALVFSAMSLEANVYDYMTAGDRGETSPLGSRRFRSQDHRLPLLERYKLLYSALLPGQTLPLDKGIGQEVRALVLLRDEIVHAKTEWRSAPLTSRKLEALLGNRFSKNPYLSGDHYFPGQCLSLAAARWAVSTVRQFATEYSRQTGLRVNIANAA